MTFSWLVLAICVYGSYAKHKQSNNYMSYDNAYNNLLQQSAARVASYNDNEYYDEDYDDQYDDEDYNLNDYSELEDDYTNALYNQYLLNNYYNQLYQNQLYQNQMNRMYTQMLAGQQQMDEWENLNNLNYDQSTDYINDMEYLSELDWTEADDEIFTKLFSKMKDKAKGWLEKKCTTKEKEYQQRLEKCQVDFGDKNPLKTIPDTAFKSNGGDQPISRQQFQKFFEHLVYQMDVFLESIVRSFEEKAYEHSGINKIPLARSIIDGFAKSLLEDDFVGVVDKVFMKLVDKVANMNGLSTPNNFKIGDTPPPKVNMEVFAKALKQLRYRKAFKKAIGWIGCKFMKILEAGKKRFFPIFKKDAMSMIKRCGTNYFAGKLVDRIEVYATSAFDDMTKEVKWTPDMFKDWLDCLKKKGGINIEQIAKTKGKSLYCVPICFKEIDGKYGITSGLKKGVQNAGKNTLQRAKDDVKSLKKEALKLKDKAIEEGTEKIGELAKNAIQEKIEQATKKARRRRDDDWYDYYDY